MSALGSVTGLPAWHPPRAVLEFAELVLTGELDVRVGLDLLSDEAREFWSERIDEAVLDLLRDTTLTPEIAGLPS